jgi:hypothetical protein
MKPYTYSFETFEVDARGKQLFVDQCMRRPGSWLTDCREPAQRAEIILGHFVNVMATDPVALSCFQLVAANANFPFSQSSRWSAMRKTRSRWFKHLIEMVEFRDLVIFEGNVLTAAWKALIREKFGLRRDYGARVAHVTAVRPGTPSPDGFASAVGPVPQLPSGYNTLPPRGAYEHQLTPNGSHTRSRESGLLPGVYQCAEAQLQHLPTGYHHPANDVTVNHYAVNRENVFYHSTFLDLPQMAERGTFRPLYSPDACQDTPSCSGYTTDEAVSTLSTSSSCCSAHCDNHVAWNGMQWRPNAVAEASSDGNQCSMYSVARTSGMYHPSSQQQRDVSLGLNPTAGPNFGTNSKFYRLPNDSLVPNQLSLSAEMELEEDIRLRPHSLRTAFDCDAEEIEPGNPESETMSTLVVLPPIYSSIEEARGLWNAPASNLHCDARGGGSADGEGDDMDTC